MRKIMIFGGGGFVGGNIATVAREHGYDVVLADRQIKEKMNEFRWAKVDIIDEHAVCEIIKTEKPDAVVNVAAIADIELAQREQDLAYSVNVIGAKNIAKACQRYAAKYVFFSSDAVYDGKKSLYKESDETKPVNYYGETKLMAEQEVMKAAPNAVVIRISLVMGYPLSGGNSFFAGLEDKLKSNKAVLCPESEIRTPIDVTTLSECVIELAQSTFAGVMHLGSTNSVSRYALTQKVAEIMGYDINLVHLRSETMNDKRTPRHDNGIIDVALAKGTLTTTLLSVDESIKRAYETRLLQK